jgi:hypothetical protein
MSSEPPAGTDALRAPDPANPSAGRVIDAKRVRGLISSGAKNLEHRLEQYRMVEDAYDRIPPDTEEQLRADGLGWAANVDWGGMEAGIDSAASPFVNLLTEPEPFVKFASTAKIPNLHHALTELARADAEMLKEWPDWIYEAQMMIHNRVAHGMGLFYFPQPHGWHFQSLHPANLITPPKAGLNPERWPWCAVVTEFEVSDLLAKLADKEEAANQGWSATAVRQAIEKYRLGDGARWPHNLDVDQAVHGFSNHTLMGVFDEAMTIKGFIFYVREADGKISEYWLTNQEEVGFLYQRQKKQSKMSRVISVFPHGLGSGYLNKVRGHGIKSLPYHDLENRSFNHSIDVTFLASNLMLRGNGQDLHRLPEMVFGPVTVIPDDLTLEQQSFQNPAGGLVQLYREMNAMRAGRNQVFGGNVDVSPNVDRTASGARMRYQEQTGIRSHDVARFYHQVRMFHRARWDRIVDAEASDSDPGMPEAREMLQRAVDNGCPPEAIAGIYKVNVVTVFGEGDPVNQFLAMMDVKELYGQLTPTGRKVYARATLNARLRDPDLVDQLVGKADALIDEADSRHRQVAQGENADFQSSDVRIDVAETDNHLIHAGEHTVFTEDTLGQLREGAISEEDAFRTVSRVRAHVGPHLEMVASDPLSQAEAKDLQRRWADITNSLRQLAQKLEAKRQRQQEEQLEEIRNPRPSVKDQEVALTEEVKRQSILRETETKISIMEREARFRMGQEMQEAAREGRIAELKRLPTESA